MKGCVFHVTTIFFFYGRTFFLTLCPVEHLDLFKKVVLEGGFCPSAEN